MDERIDFLRHVIMFAAGGLVALEGERDATADVYRIADSMLGCAE